jgi:hypothetical protein
MIFKCYLVYLEKNNKTFLIHFYKKYLLIFLILLKAAGVPKLNPVSLKDLESL